MPQRQWAPPPPIAERVTRVGNSVQGRPIRMVQFGPTTGRPVLIIGGIHGSEPTSAYVAEELIAYLKANPKEATRPVAIIAIGPDGVQVKPVVDATKLGLAALAAWGAVALTAFKMFRSAR